MAEPDFKKLSPEKLGRMAALDGQPITENPYLQAACVDLGWVWPDAPTASARWGLLETAFNRMGLAAVLQWQFPNVYRWEGGWRHAREAMRAEDRRQALADGGPLHTERDAEGIEVASYDNDRGTPEVQAHGRATETTVIEKRTVVEDGTKRHVSEQRVVRRTQDVLLVMRKGRTITAKQERAGRFFLNDWELSAWDPLRTPDLEGVHGSGGPSSGEVPYAVAAARDRLWGALECLGGLGSYGAKLAIGVICSGQSVKEWGEGTSIFGTPKRLGKERAAGMFILALDQLAAHYEREGRFERVLTSERARRQKES